MKATKRRNLSNWRAFAVAACSLATLTCEATAEESLKASVTRSDVFNEKQTTMVQPDQDDATSKPRKRVSRNNQENHQESPQTSIDLANFEPDQNFSGLRATITDHDTLIPRAPFDLGVDCGNPELVLAWELWHKQFAKTIYYRAWSKLEGTFADGSATLSFNVTRTGQVTITVLESSGDPRVGMAYADAAESLRGNRGIMFPNGSKRTEVNFRYGLIYSPRVKHGGYTWKKNDFEVVKPSGQ